MRMKKKLLMIINIFICTNAFAANWQGLGESGPNSVYFIDMDSIKGADKKFSATLKRNLLINGQPHSVKEVYTYNCELEQQTLTYAQAYKGYDFSGPVFQHQFQIGVVENIIKNNAAIGRKSFVIACQMSKASSSSIKEMTPSGPYCSKATGLSKGFAEIVGSRMRVSVSSVSLLRASQDSYGSCAITVDTAKGPQSCVGASVYTDGKVFWIGGSCF